jgi:hypothetical protein
MANLQPGPIPMASVNEEVVLSSTSAIIWDPALNIICLGDTFFLS